MVKMYHDDPAATGGPTTADVPKGGVEMMRRAGWYTKGIEAPGKAFGEPDAEKGAGVLIRATGETAEVETTREEAGAEVEAKEETEVRAKSKAKDAK